MLLHHANLSLLLMTTSIFVFLRGICFDLLDKKIYPTEAVNRSPLGNRLVGYLGL